VACPRPIHWQQASRGSGVNPSSLEQVATRLDGLIRTWRRTCPDSRIAAPSDSYQAAIDHFPCPLLSA
jgi:hypothetical protein